MRIYVDTSVFGGCFDSEFEIWSNRLIEQFKIGKFKAVISEVSEFELKFAPNHIKQILTGIPSKYLEIAKLTEESKKLSEHYLKEKIVTKKIISRYSTYSNRKCSTS